MPLHPPPALLRLATAPVALVLLAAAARAAPDSAITLFNISYRAACDLRTNAAMEAACRLDLRYPKNTPGFATVVWFHGGGLTGGRRHFVELKDRSVAVAAVGYRLSPQAELPGFIEDAAAATAWVIRNIGSYGGDSNRVFVAGPSAGGYLTAMIGMDPQWLAAHQLSPLQLAGLIPISAQVTTHFHVKRLLGDTGPQYRPLIDAYAPLYHCASNLPPICLVTGDRALEFKCRVEENELLAASLRTLGHPCVEFHEMGGLDHGTVGEGGLIVLNTFLRARARAPRAPQP